MYPVSRSGAVAAEWVLFEAACSFVVESAAFAALHNIASSPDWAPVVQDVDSLQSHHYFEGCWVDDDDGKLSVASFIGFENLHVERAFLIVTQIGDARQNHFNKLVPVSDFAFDSNSSNCRIFWWRH